MGKHNKNRNCVTGICFCVITKKALAVRKYHFILKTHSTKIDQSILIKLLPKTRIIWKHLITIGKIKKSYIKTVNRWSTHHPSLSFIHIPLLFNYIQWLIFTHARWLYFAKLVSTQTTDYEIFAKRSTYANYTRF